MTGAIRAAAAALIFVTVLAAGPPRAVATTSSPVPPVLPAAAPAGADQGRLPCLTPFCNPLSNLEGPPAQLMAGAVLNAFGTFLADAVKTVLQQVALGISSSTEVKIDAKWLADHTATMRALAVLVLLPLMLVGLISAVIQRDPRQLLRAGGVYVPIAIIGGAAAIGLTATAIKVTDDLTQAVTGADLAVSTGKAFTALEKAIETVSSPGTPGLGFFLADIVMLVLLAAALVIWIELLLRTSAIYVVVLFLPIAMTGLVWRATAHWARRMVEVLVALILSKFVIVVVIDLAAGMVTAGDGVATILQGATLLLLAACAPFALLRLVPIVEAGVIGHLERMERRPIAAATRATVAVASQVIGGAEAASAGQSLGANGGDAGRALLENRTAGGELNDVHPPEGWSAASGRPQPPAGVGGLAGPDAGGPAGLGPAMSIAAVGAGAPAEPAAETSGGE